MSTVTDQFEGGLLTETEGDEDVLTPRERLVAVLAAALDEHASSATEEVSQEDMLADLITDPTWAELIDAARLSVCTGALPPQPPLKG